MRFHVMRFIAHFVAGMACIPLTYNLVRQGDILLAFALVVAATSAVAALYEGILARGEVTFGFRLAALFFVAGVATGEAASFALYFFTYGYQDAKFVVGVAVSIFEFLSIALIGSVTVFIIHGVFVGIAKTNRGN